MTASPTLQWSSAVQDILACARGRLPAAFLSRRLADLGLGEVPPLPREDLARFEQAVDLVNLLASGRPAPAGVKPDQAMAAAFPDDHATLGKLRPLAQAHLSSLRPAKAPGRKPEEARAPEREARHDRPERRPMRDDRGPMRDDRGPRRDDRRGDYGDRREPRATPPPRPPRVSWEQYLAMHFGSPAPVVPAPAPAAEPAAPVAEGAAAAEGAAPAPAPAVVPPAPVVPALAPVLPPSLAAWSVDGDAKRQLARIRDRVVQVATKPAEQELAPLVRELAFAILRPPLGVRDDLRLMIAEHLGRLGIAVSVAALHPPPPVAALRRDWEGLLAARGPDDAAVAQAWKKLIEAHPEARGKLEAEREHERTELVKRFAQSLREHGDEAPQTAELRSRLLARVAGAAAVVEAETARWKAAAEAAATCGKLIAERGWGHPEVAAAIAACEAADPGAAGRFEQQRRHEREELERRFRNALRQGGPDHETVTAAIAHLSERFPAEGAAAAARRERARRGEDLSQQEQARREAGKSLSEVHLGSAEHRPWLLRAAPRWRLVVSVTGARQREAREPKDAAREGGREGKEQSKEGERPRRGGHAVALLVPGAVEGGLVPAGFRAPECGRLDELDAAFQSVLDRPWGVVGLALSDCPDRGAGAWGDAAAALAALVSATLPVEGRCELALELPAWAEADAGQLAALDRALAAGGSRIAVARTTGGDDAAAALAEALCWTWGGKRDSETARLRQSGLAGSCFLQPSPAVRDTLARLGEGALPGWNALSALQVEAAGDANGAAAALLARCGERLAADAESATALHRHLAGQARGRSAEPARLARELAWFESTGGSLL
ncbi:MAG: hypothetical protein L6R48_14565, partial [Planctomycetes bacterium]|nr:hypothetical protein [Planctomycetota bacterium]